MGLTDMNLLARRAANILQFLGVENATNLQPKRKLSRFVPSRSGIQTADVSVAKLDAVQVELLKEPCIVVDENDVAIGTESKKNCHLFSERNPKGYYTNTCCSHPLYTPDEMEERGAVGVVRAAQRRLENELGIPMGQMPLHCFNYLTRIQYCSPSNDKWGEHEIDYILIAKRDVDVRPNPEEVQEISYVKRDDMPAFLASLANANIPITPWFSLIVNNFLYKWWDSLDNLDHLKDHEIIHRL